MKYYKFYNKEQEIMSDFFADAASILGLGLYTLVSNPLPKMITASIGCKRLKMIARFIFKKPNDVVIKFYYTPHKVCVS